MLKLCRRERLVVENEYSVKDVARIFELQEARLRYWAQTGFVGPSVRRRGRGYYTFKDLIGVRLAKELLDKGLTLQRVRRPPLWCATRLAQTSMRPL